MIMRLKCLSFEILHRGFRANNNSVEVLKEI